MRFRLAARVGPLVAVVILSQTAAALSATQEPPADAGELFGIRYASQPEEGLLFAGQPNAQQLEALAKAGYKMVIDLRTEGEERGFNEADVAQKLGLTYLNLPTTGESLATPEHLEQFTNALGEAKRPVIVHCASSNRVGALYYAYLVRQKKVPRPEALRKAQTYGLRSPRLVEAVDALLSSLP